MGNVDKKTEKGKLLEMSCVLQDLMEKRFSFTALFRYQLPLE